MQIDKRVRRGAAGALVAAAVVATVAVGTGAAASGPGSGGSGSGYGNGSGSGSGNSGSGNGGRSLRAVGLTADQKLVVVDTDRPGRTRGGVAVRGLASGDRLVGIDYRVQDGKLYGVGRAGGVYTLAQDGRATKVSQLSVDLQGRAFGVDFNPAADRLRVVGDTGQNLRHDVNTLLGPTVVDGTLTYPATPTAPAATATGVTGAAYTNNDLDPDTATTLYDIDTALDQVVIQSPANAGLLAATGKLRVDATGDAGFDIYSTVRGGRTVDLTAFATLKVGGTYRLYAVTLFNGGARSVGSFPAGQQVTDLAIPLNQR